ncbi:phosphoglycerate mutase family protein [Lysinibacillus sphaericus]
MEFIFIRHGQGEHTLDLPDSLHTSDPSLTVEGINQAKALKSKFPLTRSDVLIISPIRRTLQTAQIWSEGISCKKLVSPLVSPRMFPQNPEWETLPCDQILTKDTIKEAFPDFHVEEEQADEWWEKGINTLTDTEFGILAKGFLERCKSFGTNRVFIVSHDGTITSYRQFITGKEFTRKDFPKEAGFLKVQSNR